MVVALAHAIRRLREDGAETVLEHPPAGESQSNGVIEKSVDTIVGLMRTMLDALETRIGQKIPADSVVLTWLVEHASYIYSRFNVDKNGRTPYERWKGRKCRRALGEFGERECCICLSRTPGAASWTTSSSMASS